MDYCGIIPKDLAIGALWPQIGAFLTCISAHFCAKFKATCYDLNT